MKLVYASYLSTELQTKIIISGDLLFLGYYTAFSGHSIRTFRQGRKVIMKGYVFEKDGHETFPYTISNFVWTALRKE